MVVRLCWTLLSSNVVLLTVWLGRVDTVYGDFKCVLFIG